MHRSPAEEDKGSLFYTKPKASHQERRFSLLVSVFTSPWARLTARASFTKFSHCFRSGLGRPSPSCNKKWHISLFTRPKKENMRINPAACFSACVTGLIEDTSTSGRATKSLTMSILPSATASVNSVWSSNCAQKNTRIRFRCLQFNKKDNTTNTWTMSYHRLPGVFMVWFVQHSQQCLHHIGVIKADGPFQSCAQLSRLPVQLQVHAWVRQQYLHNLCMTQITRPAQRCVVVLQKTKR